MMGSWTEVERSYYVNEIEARDERIKKLKIAGNACLDALNDTRRATSYGKRQIAIKALYEAGCFGQEEE